MNRNNERHFNNIPQMKTSRSRFKMKQDIKLTLNAGDLVPFYVAETLPGDTFSVDTKGICRMSTPIYPVMDNCYLDIYYFHVPMRIVWDHTKQFFGENDTEAWTQKTEYTIPKIVLKADPQYNIPFENSILDYMGIPTKVFGGAENRKTEINALPVRGYIKIWNEWFRDQNVDNPAVLKTGDENVTYVQSDGTNKQDTLNTAYAGGRLLWVNKFHDRFTSALPYPQKGGTTLIPLSGNAIVGFGSASTKKLYNNENFEEIGWESTPTGWKHGVNGMSANTKVTANNGNVAGIGTYPTDSGVTEAVNLIADLSQVQSATINNLRQAFAVQQFMEADARGGSRYREIVRNHFGVDIDDKTVQIPEYLGGQRYMINVNQVVQTSSTDNKSPQGNAAAISVTPFMENSFTKSFQEHGYVIGVCCIRNDNTYQQGIEKLWSRTEKFDFYWPEFAHLGEQAILNKEIYAQGTEDDEKAFGYQEAYSEYRMTPNRVCGAFRSNAEQPLDAWHYADNYNKLPTLSQEWLATDKTVIDRTIAKQNQPQFIMDVLVENDAVRPMPIYGTPGLTKL